MALVLLPCDLPSWPAVQRHLNLIKNAQNSSQLLDGMQKLHGVCCISLDPDENDKSDPLIFFQLQNFLDVCLSDEERRDFFTIVLPSLVSYALRLNVFKPYDGLHYSLQQQADRTELDRKFVASLVANAFFSTFPRRTRKTHPTLQDCNFSKSFVHLKSLFQQKKLREMLRYFESIAEEEPRGKMVLVRRVMSRKCILDVEDWLSCDRPLCPVIIRHNGKIEQAELGTYQICFSSDRIGGAVLEGGESQEDLMFCVFPELYVALLFVETLEKNEALTVHGMRSMAPSSAPLTDDVIGVLNSHVCLIDAVDFSAADAHCLQYEEGEIVRDANKAFVGFHQRQSPLVRLPPIGKSFSSTPSENRSEARTKSIPRPAEDSDRDLLSLNTMKNLLGQKGGLCSLVDKILKSGCDEARTAEASQGSLNGRVPECESVFRLTSKSGSSTPVVHQPPSSPKKRESDPRRPLAREDSDDSVYGDCREDVLPDDAVGAGISAQRPLTLKKQQPLPESPSRNLRVPQSPATNPLEGANGMDSSFMSCISHVSDSSSSGGASDRDGLPLDEDGEEDDGFASCVEDFEEDVDNRRLVLPKQRLAEIAEVPVDFQSWRGRRALADTLQGRLPEIPDDDDDGSNFAVDIHIADPEAVPDPEDFVLRRSASTGFILEEDDDDLFLGDGLEHEREWLAHFRHRSVAPSRSSLSRRNSSRYSFSSDFSSDLEDIYEHFEEKMTEGPVRENPAYSGRRSMKRTLSDSLTSFLPPTARRTGLPPRSLSLTEKMQEEMSNIEMAKQNLNAPKHREEDRKDEEVKHEAASRDPPPLNLSEIEEEEEHQVTLPFPAWCRRPPLAPQPSVWWNYNRVYEFHVPLKRKNPTSASGGDGGLQGSLRRVFKLDSILEASESSGSDGRRGSLPVPIRRSRSATDVRSECDGIEGGGGFGSIARSSSCDHIDGLAEERKINRRMTAMPEAGIGGRPRLKKWHAAGDLSRGNGDATGPATTGPTTTKERLSIGRSRKRADRRKVSGGQCLGLMPHESRETSEQRLDLELDVEGIKPLATGNWGCDDKCGDPQLKALIQWMAASRANVPFMIYYTGGDQRVVKLNIVCRVLLDRHWSVSHVLRAVLRHCSSKSDKPSSSPDVDLLDSLLPKETDL